MKKKRVSKVASKKSARRVSGTKKKSGTNSKASQGKAVSGKSPLKSKSGVLKKSPSKKNKPAGRSLRISQALKKIPKKVLPKIKTDTFAEPMSYVLPQVQTITDLPFSYNETKLVLLLRDPFWAFTYWDFSSETWNWIGIFCEQDAGAKTKLRVHNLDLKTFYDLDVFLDAKQWYVDLGIPDTSFELELGLLDSYGRFHRIALSNRTKTPRSAPSEHMDPEWELSDFEFSEIYRLSGGGFSGPGSEIFSSMRRPK